MTQAFNLAQLANNLNTSGQLDATDGLSGLVANANLASSGSASSSTYLRGDRTWAVLAQEVLNVTYYQQASLSNSTTSTTFVDSGWSFNVTAVNSNPLIVIECFFNNTQENTWCGGSVRWLKSVAGGAYTQIGGENSNSGMNFLTAVPTQNNKSSAFSFVVYDNNTSGVTAGQTITYKLQMKAWSGSNTIKLGCSVTDGDTMPSTTTPGTQYFIFTEVQK